MMVENGIGQDGGNLMQQLSSLTISENDSDFISSNHSNNTSKNDGLYQVIKAVEAAEATIKQQVEENNRLRYELQKKIQELEKYKSDDTKAGNFKQLGHWSDQVQAPQSKHETIAPTRSQRSELRFMNNSTVNDSSTIGIQEDINHDIMFPLSHDHEEKNLGSDNVYDILKVTPDGSAARGLKSSSQIFSRVTDPVSPSRFQFEEENDGRNVLVPIADSIDNGSHLKLDVATGEREQEVVQLRKHLANFSIREAQIQNEKFALEKRIAYMRMAFDQQQQDMVDTASKALSYRQDIIEENIRLTYALQDALEERSTFVSLLMSLLAEYSLQPPVVDAQSIISNLKVLFRHLQEKLAVTEAKLKESQYQLAAWHADASALNNSRSPFQSSENKMGLELVPQQAYTDRKIPILSDPVASRDWGVTHSQRGVGDGAGENMEAEELGRQSPLGSRTTKSPGMPAQLVGERGSLHPAHRSEETVSKQVTFGEPSSSNIVDDPDGERRHNEGERLVNWGFTSSPYSTMIDDPGSSYSPYLPPVLEEPTSSFSEAADDDPLPAVESLQISGEAFPGRELQASGYSLNGTTSCNFEWVRHLEDGSVNYIVGAKQPKYLVTADDVDTYLAIEVHPMDNRNRKGELVKVFANENRKIVCDPEMRNHIERTLYAGQASYKLSLSTGYLDIWEPAALVIKRESYSIKASGPSGIFVTEKFSPTTVVVVPYGYPDEFSIIGSGGVERRLRMDNLTDVSCWRDTVVLTMRLFIKRVGERKKGKKKSLFFK